MDEMFFASDGKSLQRGKRRDRRTPTCRPCRIWRASDPDNPMDGVIMDANRYGMCIRMLARIEVDEPILVQLMRDEQFREPMAVPLEGRVARQIPDGGGFYDHGIQLFRGDIRREESRPVVMPKRPAAMPIKRTRMHTLDITIGDRDDRSRR
jgi:hypothetical protein